MGAHTNTRDLAAVINAHNMHTERSWMDQCKKNAIKIVIKYRILDGTLKSILHSCQASQMSF